MLCEGAPADSAGGAAADTETIRSTESAPIQRARTRVTSRTPSRPYEQLHREQTSGPEVEPSVVPKFCSVVRSQTFVPEKTNTRPEPLTHARTRTATFPSAEDGGSEVSSRGFMELCGTLQSWTVDTSSDG